MGGEDKGWLGVHESRAPFGLVICHVKHGRGVSALPQYSLHGAWGWGGGGYGGGGVAGFFFSRQPPAALLRQRALGRPFRVHTSLKKIPEILFV